MKRKLGTTVAKLAQPRSITLIQTERDDIHVDFSWNTELKRCSGRITDVIKKDGQTDTEHKNAIKRQLLALNPHLTPNARELEFIFTLLTAAERDIRLISFVSISAYHMRLNFNQNGDRTSALEFVKSTLKSTLPGAVIETRHIRVAVGA